MNKTSLLAIVLGLLLNQTTTCAGVYINIASEDEIRIFTDSDNKDAIEISSAEEIQDRRTLVFKTKIETPKRLSIAAKYQSANKLPYHQEVLLAAHATALEPALIHAVIAVESGHNPKARSPKGAVGLMQLMPATAQQFSISVVDAPSKNILAGAKYLRELLNTYDGNLPLALAAYNAGPNAVKKYRGKIPPYTETQRYVPKVLVHYQQFAKPYSKL